MLQHVLDGPEAAPPLILGPSLGTSTRIWRRQVDVLARRFRVLRFDLPGHGGSAPADGVRSIADLAALVVELADHYGWATFRYAGVSLSGAIGATIAAQQPDRVECLALIGASARFGEPEAWRERAARVRAEGTEFLVEPTSHRWFAGEPDADLLADLAAADPASYASCCDALSAYDLRTSLSAIVAPTLLIGGRQDPAAPPSDQRLLADSIPTATLIELPFAAHLALVDQPDAVLRALVEFFDAGLDSLDSGMAVRRAVLGDAYVDRSLANRTPFTSDFQDFITRYAWGEIWTRPGLDRRTRSIITLTALVARGHLEELELHLRGALTNGLTPDEIKEVLLQTAVYCGVPAANSAFVVAARVLDEHS
jgi:3-oxoadipate enol-lactonase/4-carboxymuconolactone decarboxylase